MSSCETMEAPLMEGATDDQTPMAPEASSLSITDGLTAPVLKVFAI